MRITTIVNARDDEDLVPHFMDYYTSFSDEIIFIDFQSEDRTREIVMSYFHKTKCNIELRVNPSIGLIDDYNESMLPELNYNPMYSLLYIKNNLWQNLNTRSINDWIITVDIDEFLYHPKGIRTKLEECRQSQITLPRVIGFDMFSETFPDHSKGENIIEKVRSGYEWEGIHKHCVFDTKYISELNFIPGAHACSPVGLVNKGEEDPDKINLLHFKYLDYDRFIKKQIRRSSTLSEYNKKRVLSNHFDSLKTFTREQFNEHVKNPTANFPTIDNFIYYTDVHSRSR